MFAQPEIVDLMNKARATLAGAGAGLSEEVTQTSPPRSSSVGSGGGRGGVRGTSTKKGKKGKEKGFCDVLVKLGGAAVTRWLPCTHF